jgi:hypothetical protein
VFAKKDEILDQIDLILPQKQEFRNYCFVRPDDAERDAQEDFDDAQFRIYVSLQNAATK